MSPTSSSRPLAGRKARSAALRTMLLELSPVAGALRSTRASETMSPTPDPVELAITAAQERARRVGPGGMFARAMRPGLIAAGLLRRPAGGRLRRRSARTPTSPAASSRSTLSRRASRARRRSPRARRSDARAQHRRQEIPNLAVTITTDAATRGDSVRAFGQNLEDTTLADRGRPVWIVDSDPSGGQTASRTRGRSGPRRAADEDRALAGHRRARRALHGALPRLTGAQRQGPQRLRLEGVGLVPRQDRRHASALARRRGRQRRARRRLTDGHPAATPGWACNVSSPLSPVRMR